MKTLEMYNVPDDFNRCAFENLMEDMVQSRSNAKLYFNTMTKIIHLEELSEKKKIACYNLERIKLTIRSSVERKFSIQSEQFTVSITSDINVYK